MSADSLPEFHKDVAEKHEKLYNCHPCRNPKCNRMAGIHHYCDACMWMIENLPEKRYCACCGEKLVFECKNYKCDLSPCVTKEDTENE